MTWWPFNKQEPEHGIPADLSTAIEAASVVFRDFGGEDGEGRLLVRVAGTGAWYWSGTNEAAERFQRMHDLPPATARKAARLLASVVASRNRAEYRQPRQRRSSWVFSGWETL
ncbi:hypothetical protein SAMN05660479_00931 [Microbulbifer thermotolerans]|uniref:hypothetical protein n=1 Tax=Microbulbifer thermotolerans TaxID=252514 RepID=UPI0008F1D518|nr:hypothetical protein [Microbulbifer thermotolerans]SFB94933.1 hypothetical protein SAMN05660479_00931 [Microbulbifer thermotolerans]